MHHVVFDPISSQFPPILNILLKSSRRPHVSLEIVSPNGFMLIHVALAWLDHTHACCLRKHASHSGSCLTAALLWCALATRIHDIPQLYVDKSRKLAKLVCLPCDDEIA